MHKKINILKNISFCKKVKKCFYEDDIDACFLVGIDEEYAEGGVDAEGGEGGDHRGRPDKERQQVGH